MAKEHLLRRETGNETEDEGDDDKEEEVEENEKRGKEKMEEEEHRKDQDLRKEENSDQGFSKKRGIVRDAKWNKSLKEQNDSYRKMYQIQR